MGWGRGGLKLGMYEYRGLDEHKLVLKEVFCPKDPEGLYGWFDLI